MENCLLSGVTREKEALINLDMKLIKRMITFVL